jgi:arginyl-tRNA synthetase
MYDYREAWKTRIAGALNQVLRDLNISGTIEASQLIAELPPKPELGDIGFPMFGYAKLLRKGPPQIAQLVCEKLAAAGQSVAAGEGGAFEALGPYVNVRLDRAATAAAILGEVLPGPADGDAAADYSYGRPGTFAGKRIMVEFSSPNTNKPLHLGHLRNDVLGESVSRILKACGADVR